MTSLTIYKRELTSYSAQPTAYAIIVIFLALSMGLTFSFGNFMRVGDASLEWTFFFWHPWIFMLLAPFLLTLGMGLVTGRFSGRATGISDIPVVIVNQDEGELGQALVDIFSSEDLAELVEPSLGTSPEAARLQVDEDEVAAAIIIPAGFSRSVIPQESDFAGGNTPEVVKIEMYANPSRPTSAGIRAGWFSDD